MMHIGDATDMSATSLRFQALTANLWPLTLDRNRLGRFETCDRGDYVSFEFYRAGTISSGEVCGA
jgi:hypothetical protein